MKLRQPSEERNKEFFLMVQTLFNQDTYIVGSNLLNYYDQSQVDDLNKCEKFRTRTTRMNAEGQSCLLDLVDTDQNQLAGCVGCVKVNRIDREAFLVLIFYQQYFNFIGEAVKCFFDIIRSPKYNLRSMVCNASGYQLGAEAVEVLLHLGFTDVTDERPRSDQNPLWLRYIDPTAPPPSEPSTRRDRSVSSRDGEERWSAHSSSRQGPGSIPEVCRYWIRGQCKFGADCRFLHEAPASPSPSSTPPHSPGLPDASTAPTAGPAAGPPVFLYPQMVYAVPVAGAGEYEPSFAAPSEAPALQQEVSFASYSTVSQDMTEYRHRSHSGVAISAVPSMESGWDAPPTSEFPQEYDAPGGVPARRTRSEDTIATTRMYERSAALAQRARTEVAELLDLVNTAHPQWLFHLRFSPQFVAASPAAASSRVEERRARTSPTSAQGQAPPGAPERTSSAKWSPVTETSDTSRHLTSADLHALNRYYETADPPSEVYRRLFWPAAQGGDGHVSTSSTSTEEYALESVHTARTGDFTAHGQPPPQAMRERRMPSQPTRERRAQRSQELTELQRTRFLIHCRKLDPQGSSEQMLGRAQPLLKEAHRAQDLRKVGGLAVKTRSSAREAEEVPVPSKAGPRYLTQEMVTALLAFRQHRGVITSIPAFLGVVRLTTSASSAESMISLNRAVAESYARAKAEVIKQQQYFVALQQQYQQQQLQLQLQQTALQEQQEQLQQQRNTQGLEQDYQDLRGQHQQRQELEQQQLHLQQFGQQAATPAPPRYGILGGPQLPPTQQTPLLPTPAPVICAVPAAQVAPALPMQLSQAAGAPQATQEGAGTYTGTYQAGAPTFMAATPSAQPATAGGYLPAMFPAAYQYGQAVPVPVQVSPRALLVNAQQRTPFMPQGRNASASTPVEPLRSATYRQAMPVQSGATGSFMQAVMGTSAQMPHYVPQQQQQLSMSDTVTGATEGRADTAEGGRGGEDGYEPGAQPGSGMTGSSGRGSQRRSGRRRHGLGGAG